MLNRTKLDREVLLGKDPVFLRLGGNVRIVEIAREHIELVNEIETEKCKSGEQQTDDGAYLRHDENAEKQKQRIADVSRNLVSQRNELP